ncbi:RNA polymerase sigma factor [Paracrocinitomix mangrovi]|uniref:RNA polymerase sigma factor n=1 Tax=Paracrocinitomix mangrovi TaxID=2862509 RepID=UPI001C8E5132|nr:RNA polymerase sigma factor [Paracrocinitomix mangrovi]UKN01524.1 RNA polymerase sigma factor [Paracrocinitomix mangrovi]
MNRREYNMAVKEFSGRLFGYSLKYLQNSEDASDIVQDVFEKLWKNRKKVEPDKVKSWLFTCAHNAMINFIKKRSRMSYMDDVQTSDVQESHTKSYEMKEVIEKCLSQLPPIQKSIILLRDMEGYNYKEIGDILELSEAQVKVYLFRARNKIKKQLKDLTVLV